MPMRFLDGFLSLESSGVKGLVNILYPILFRPLSDGNNPQSFGLRVSLDYNFSTS